MRDFSTAVFLAAFTALIACRPAMPQRPAQVASSPAGSRSSAPFVVNAGQWPASADFVARLGTTQMTLDRRGWMLVQTAPSRPLAPHGAAPHEAALREGFALRMQFEGGTAATLRPQTRLPGWHNYLLGNDPSRWRTRVPLFAEVHFAGLYPGIDVVVRTADAAFEYDFLLAPGADLGRVVVRVDGAERLRVTPDGSLCIDTPLGPLVQPVPATWAVGDGATRPVRCQYVLLGPDRFGFAAPDWSRADRLVIDPRLLFATYLGTSLDDLPGAIDTGAGAITLAGNTQSAAFPVTAGAFSTRFTGNRDAFVTRFDPSGSRLQWSTFLGGALWEGVMSIRVLADGATVVGGDTESGDFPTTPGAYDTTFNGVSDCFVLKLDGSGSSLLWSTFVGGSGVDQTLAMATDALGVASIVGLTYSLNYPTTAGAFRRAADGGFATRVAADGSSLVWSTYFPRLAHAQCAALDASGNLCVATAADANFPVTQGAYSTRPHGPQDVAVALIDASGQFLRWASFLGGSWVEYPQAVAVDARGSVVVAGYTHSGDFPTTPGALRRSWVGRNSAGYVTRFRPDGSALGWSTFLTGNLFDTPTAAAIDADGSVVVAGWTGSGDFPTTPDGFARFLRGGTDAFVSRLHASGSRLLYSTFFGGDGNEEPTAIRLGVDSVFVVGRTNSANHPTTSGCYGPTYGGGFDVVAAHLQTTPTGVVRFGDATPHCAGTPTIHALEDATVGRTDFGVAVSGAPASAPGLLALADRRPPAGFPFLGMTVWFDPLTVIAAPNVVANSAGECAVRFGLPVQADFVAQFAFLDPLCPSSLTGSDALAVAAR